MDSRSASAVLLFMSALLVTVAGCSRGVQNIHDDDGWLKKARHVWTGETDINGDGTPETLTIAVIEPRFAPVPMDIKAPLLLVTVADIRVPKHDRRMCFHELDGDPGVPSQDWVQDVNHDGNLKLVFTIDGKRHVESGGYCLLRNF